MNKYWRHTGLIFLLTAAFAGWAVAGDEQRRVDKRTYLVPLTSYSAFNEHNFEPDDGFGGQLGLGRSYTEHIALELYAYHFDSIALEGTSSSDDEIDTTGYGLSALFFPARDVLPVFGLVGIGLGEHGFRTTSMPAGIEDQGSEFVDFGVGFIAPLTDYGMALRGEYRYRASDVENPAGPEFRFRDNVVSLGLQIPLSAKQEYRKPAPAPQPAPPAPAPAPPPPDGDNDGVPDVRDRCPDTAPGTEVDENGCAIEEEEPEEEAPIVLRGVNFELDSAVLTVNAERHLDEVAAKLRANENAEVLIEGHTDSIGEAAYNLDLSQRRAESVKAYLTRRGIDASRLQARGYGETRPVAPNTRPDGSDDPEGRAQNRRVELHIADQ